MFADLHCAIKNAFDHHSFHLFPRTFSPPATKLEQGYVFTHVCDSVHKGAGLPQCMLGYPPPHGPGTPPLAKRHPLARQNPPAQCMLGDTVNKRAVCILLECNSFFLLRYVTVCTFGYNDKSSYEICEPWINIHGHAHPVCISHYWQVNI